MTSSRESWICAVTISGLARQRGHRLPWRCSVWVPLTLDQAAFCRRRISRSSERGYELFLVVAPATGAREDDAVAGPVEPEVVAAVAVQLRLLDGVRIALLAGRQGQVPVAEVEHVRGEVALVGLRNGRRVVGGGVVGSGVLGGGGVGIGGRAGSAAASVFRDPTDPDVGRRKHTGEQCDEGLLFSAQVSPVRNSGFPTGG